MKTTTTVSRAKAAEIMVSQDPGAWFAVYFKKRTDGTDRRMNRAQLRVKKHLKGGRAAYDFNEKMLVSVWDPEAEDRKTGKHTGGYRAVPTETVYELHANGEIYLVDPDLDGRS